MCALTDKLACVSLDALLDVLNDVPSLGRIDSFSGLLVNRIVSAPDVSTEVRETALVGLIKCISAARVAQGSGDRGPNEPTGGDHDDEERDIDEPESKVARLA